MDPIRSIRQKYKGFSKVNKRIADYILEGSYLVFSH